MGKPTIWAHLGIGAKADDNDAADTPGDDGKNDGKTAKSSDSGTDDNSDDENDEDEDEDNGEDKEEMKKAKAAGFGPLIARQRKAEKARCAAIFAAKAASGRVPMAAQLAFGTNLSASEAIGVLATVPAEQPRASSFGAAMGQVNTSQVGADGGTAPGAQTPGSSLMAATQALVAKQNRR